MSYGSENIHHRNGSQRDTGGKNWQKNGDSLLSIIATLSNLRSQGLLVVQFSDDTLSSLEARRSFQACVNYTKAAITSRKSSYFLKNLVGREVVDQFGAGKISAVSTYVFSEAWNTDHVSGVVFQFTSGQEDFRLREALNEQNLAETKVEVMGDQAYLCRYLADLLRLLTEI